MQLAQFDFKIKHKKGQLHTNADGLTRAHKPVHDEEPFTLLGALEEDVTEDLDLSLYAIDPADPLSLFPTEEPFTPTVGPRQHLLENAPCSACK